MTRHNIVLFLTDQWRWDTLNQPDHPARLPHLRAFQDEAANFTNAFTSVPLCTPARASLFTGKWPHQTGTMDNVGGQSYYPHGKLHPSHKTYMERLQTDGYNVCFIGKWHLGAGTLVERGITDCPLSDGGATPKYLNIDDLSFDGPRKDPFYGAISEGTHIDGQRVQTGIERLEELAADNKPFCLIVSLYGPHFPHHVPQEYVDLYGDLPEDYMPDNYCPQFSETGKPHAQSASYWPCQDTRGLTQDDWRKTVQHYWGFCSYIDDLFGQFRAKMRDLGLDKRTVTAFSADHGEMLGAHGWFDKRPFYYDEVMRIPMMIKAPGSAPSTQDGFAGLRDLFPTLVDCAQAETTLDAAERGRSFRSTNASYITYGYDAYQGRQFKFRGIRNERYKYSWSPHDIEELYDLASDPQERINLATSPDHQNLRQVLNSQLFDWMRSEDDAVAHGGYWLPVGSYVDGRDISEQHDHSVTHQAQT
ncbi:sulfatase-like hydrolase/transferase [Ruegeria jejuensis]|uniref:sulfatase-like hydrolase/transferase n=1 Tax=Ruegeria jejuensis TaxID=3233338 RepID=UPI00355B2110